MATSYALGLFRRGFAIVPRNFGDPRSRFEPLEHWARHPADANMVYTHPEVQITSAQGPQAEVIVLGLAVDPFAGAHEIGWIAERLAQASEPSFLQLIDDLTGRFVVIRSTRHDSWLLQDAVGTQTLFYSDIGGGVVAASHARLAALVADSDISQSTSDLFAAALKTRVGVKYLPGVLTPFSGVRALTPNTRLHLSTGKVERFWPREPLTRRLPLEEVVELGSSVLSESIRLVSKVVPLHMSLSAGLDSRVSLAALAPEFGIATYFSHVNSTAPHPVHVSDLEVAQEMASTYGLNHVVYEMGPSGGSAAYQEFYRVWFQTVGLPRGLPRLVKSYMDRWPEPAIHLRSNVGEVARVFYKSDRNLPVSATLLSSKWNRVLGDDPRAVAAFQEFMDVTSFQEDWLWGYDPLDLFYWEHRMGVWHGWICLESSMSHDTFVPFNNRRLLSELLSVPFSDRLHSQALFGVILARKPELMDWPVNPKTWPIASSADTTSRGLPPRGLSIGDPEDLEKRGRAELGRMGVEAMEAQRWHAAVQAFEAATKVGGDFWAWIWRGRAEEKYGDLHAAERSARMAHELRPGFPQAILLWARLLGSVGELEEAGFLLSSIDDTSNDGVFLVNAAELSLQLGFPRRARELAAAAIAGDLAPRLAARALAADQAGRTAEAAGPDSV